MAIFLLCLFLKIDFHAMINVDHIFKNVYSVNY